MSQPKILVAEISGKRPGDSSKRPTEKYTISYDHVIISNNSDDYITNWDIVNVPPDYVEWYKANIKNSDNAWYAPMNRSYAIKYAREHGYDYLIQLDDNIIRLELAYVVKGKKNIQKRYRIVDKDMMDDFIDMLVCVLEHTNAAMAGCRLCGIGVPDDEILTERYVYSLFALKLAICPDLFHGDFEDDIEYRLKCAEMGLPVLMVCPLGYGKTGQNGNKDETGNRAAYTQAGLKRGEHMRYLHGDVYSCGYAKKTATVRMKPVDGKKFFQHRLKSFKIGTLVDDEQAIYDKLTALLVKHSPHMPEKIILKEKKKRGVHK